MTYILPVPKKQQTGEETYRINYDCKIIMDSTCDGKVLNYANILKEEIENVLGFVPDIMKCADIPGQIYLSISNEATNSNKDSIDSLEGYKLSVNKNGIFVEGNSRVGLLFGVQTLRQIIRQENALISYRTIEDEPDIKNRGYYFDCTRGRIPTLDSLKKLAEACSFYKLNQLQLYVEHTYLFWNESESWRDNTPLTAEEIMEFDEYCSSLNIELVPSLASFGHLYTLLETNSFAHLCELEVNTSDGYSMVRRMRNHTVDVTNEESFEFVTGRIAEYMQLFKSDKFNICADETFDLGKGKSKELADKTSVTDIYVEFLGRLCNFVIEKGKIPMFWGDILVSHPEKTENLPKEAICLNWDYWPDSKEESTMNFAKAGVEHLYVCPGVQGWHHFIPNHKDAYENISRMCSYGHKYNAEGVLTTDWGDLGHITYPEFSRIGLIYGAAFSWNKNILDRVTINKQISVIEYGDKTQQIAEAFSMLAEVEGINQWCTVQYYEYRATGLPDLQMDTILHTKNVEENESIIIELDNRIDRIYGLISEISQNKKDIAYAYILMAEGQKLMTKAGTIIELQEKVEDGIECAKGIERWIYNYKKLWRKVSKESELFRTVAVFKWYADQVRLAAMNKE